MTHGLDWHGEWLGVKEALAWIFFR